MLSYCLAAFQELMEHGFMPWDQVASNKFIKKVSEPNIIERFVKYISVDF